MATNNHHTESDRSPTRRKHGKNGRTAVGRMTVVCPYCGRPWSVLYRPRELHGSVCPNCHRWECDLESNRRLEDFTVTMRRRAPFKSDPSQGVML